MSTISERVRMIRTSDKLHLTMEKFGEKLGVKKAAISDIEHGRNNLTEQMKLAICREFGVNQEWLETGEGEMFVKACPEELKKLKEEYSLDEDAVLMIEKFVTLSEDKRQAVIEYVRSVAVSMGIALPEAEREKLESEMSAKTDTSQDNMDTELSSGAKILSLEEIRALPLEERMKIMDSVPPEKLGLSNLVARKNRKDKDNK